MMDYFTWYAEKKFRYMMSKRYVVLSGMSLIAKIVSVTIMKKVRHVFLYEWLMLTSSI